MIGAEQHRVQRKGRTGAGQDRVQGNALAHAALLPALPQQAQPFLASRGCVSQCPELWSGGEVVTVWVI